MADMAMLRKKINDRGLTNEDVAHAIGIDVSTLYRKMKCNGLTFTIGQMHRLADVLYLTPTEATQIFLQ